jgi:signal transduction histidine kinase
MIILLVFSLVTFVLFFDTRYSKQKISLQANMSYNPPFLFELARDSHLFNPQRNVSGKIMPQSNSLIKIRNTELLPTILTIPIEEFSAEHQYYPLQTLSRLSRGNINIVYHDNKYFIYRKTATTVKLSDITNLIYIQIELIQLVLFWDICFTIFVYLISLYFVKSSLKQLKKLTHFAQNLDFENLSTAIHLKGHKHDEIKVIAEALNTSLEKINTQILSLKDFISNASHELKTPLMMINSEIDIALKKEHHTDNLFNIKQYLKRLSKLLDTLSLITRLESEKQWEPQKTTVQPLVHEVINEIKKQYPTKKITVTIEKDLIIPAHPPLLKIIIKNLIENACKYAGEKAQITIEATATTLSIHDTGKGIAPQYHQKIFERFRQLKKTEDEGYSFGLGLYLVKKIVQLHGWTISVTSEIKKGTTFTITW